MTARELDNRRILVPESRELDLFCTMLEQHGATTIRCPLVSILDLEDTTEVDQWLRHLIDGRLDDLILLTGEGLRRLLGVARRSGIEAATVAALGKIRTITRGPKPVRALREIGLVASLTAVAPTSEGVIQTLADLPLNGHTVGVQLYPGNPNEILLNFLAEKKATALPVLPYRYASNSDADAVARAIEDLAAGAFDLVAFTSSPQVKRLTDVARERQLEDALRAGFARTRVAAVGPVVAETLRDMGANVAIEPQSGFHLKPLVTAIRAAFAAA